VCASLFCEGGSQGGKEEVRREEKVRQSENRLVLEAGKRVRIRQAKSQMGDSSSQANSQVEVQENKKARKVMEQTEQEKSQAIYEEIVTGMKEWRLAHPKATMREIEARNRVSRLEGHLIEESALTSARVGRGGTSPLPKLRGALDRTWEACEEITSDRCERGEVGKKLWSLSQMRDRLFSPSMKNWACSRAL